MNEKTSSVTDAYTDLLAYYKDDLMGGGVIDCALLGICNKENMNGKSC